MEIVIKIEDYDREWIANGYYIPDEINEKIAEAIIDGIPLPKGHGRLIDADKLDTRERGNNSQRTMWWNIDCIVKDAPTIVEADYGHNYENT